MRLLNIAGISQPMQSAVYAYFMHTSALKSEFVTAVLRQWYCTHGQPTRHNTCQNNANTSSNAKCISPLEQI